MRPARQVAHLEHVVPQISLGSLGKSSVIVRPTIMRMSSPSRDLGHGLRVDEASVAQDRHAVGQLEDLLEAVADVDDGHAALLEEAHDA